MRSLFVAILLVFRAEAPASAQNPPDLAQQLRAARPEENSRVTGKLIVGKTHKEIPFVCLVTLSPANWSTTYETSSTPDVPAERLVIIHTTNGPNEYLYARASAPSASLPELKPVPPEKASIPLAGSDFSLADLGLDFLHWPTQRQLKGEMRLGQPCYVLESSRPAGEIVRVKSDIDKESGGLLIADAYDAKGHIVKEFSLHGSSFTKVNGQWHLEKMEIRNRKTGSRTELKFDLTK